MARSTYVYIVMDDGVPVVGFTVKHEMVSWLGRNPGIYKIHRLSDGGHRAPVEMTDDFTRV